MQRSLILILTLLSFSPSLPLNAQNEGSGSAGKIQPKIMVIPRVKQTENLKDFIDTSVNMQIALTKINEAFQKRNANIIQLSSKLKESETNSMISKAAGNNEDFRSMILQSSGADIYVEAKLDVVNHAARNAHSVTIILEGYQNGTSNLLGSKVGHSRINQTPDIGFLISQALDSITESFLVLMQSRFDDIVANGQSIYVEFNIGPDSQVDFDKEIGPDNKILSEVIDEWFQKHAMNGVFNNQGVTSTQMILSDVRIPLRQPNNPRANYTGQNLYSDLLKFFRSIKIPIKREIGTNNKLVITIQ